MTDQLAAVVLAAGKSTRFKSKTVKILHNIAGKPMIRYVLEAISGLGAGRIVLVLGQQAGRVNESLRESGISVETRVQEQQLGTGHALLQARPSIEGAAETVLCLYGDMPLLSTATLAHLYDHHRRRGATLTLLTVTSQDAMGFGRVLRDEQGAVTGIVEEDQATAEQRAITELNAGVYCFEAAWLWPHLAALPVSPRGEFFLTDTVAQAVSEGQIVEAVAAGDVGEVKGVNTRVHLAEVERVMRDRIRRELMLGGVTMVDPGTVYVDGTVQVGPDTVIHPSTSLEGRTRIGPDCIIGPGSRILDSVVGAGCRVTASFLESAEIGDGVQVGPFAHLRPGAVVRSGAYVGNFAEIKNSTLGSGSHMGHFGYVGDASIGERVNVSAGTITCNYDGERKHATEVGDGTFLGSDTLLVAPVKVGRGAQTGAGAVVTHDVADGELVVGVPARPRRRRTDASREG